jgi:hypothetical protein
MEKVKVPDMTIKEEILDDLAEYIFEALLQ